MAQIATAAGLLLNLAGVLWGLFFGLGIDRLLSLQPDAIARAVTALLSLVTLVAVLQARKWGYLLSLLLLLVGLIGNGAFIVQSGLSAVGSALDQVWLLIRLVGGALGLLYSLIATLECFGRLTPVGLNSWQSSALQLICAALVGMLAAVPMLQTPSATAEVPDRIVQLNLADNRFMPGDLELPVGKHTAIFLTNADTTVHTFDIDELNVHVTVPGHSTAMATVTPPAPGSFTFYCRIPGHQAAGMVGKMTAR